MTFLASSKFSDNLSDAVIQCIPKTGQNQHWAPAVPQIHPCTAGMFDHRRTLLPFFFTLCYFHSVLFWDAMRAEYLTKRLT